MRTAITDFYLSANDLWLVDSVPVQYLVFPNLEFY